MLTDYPRGSGNWRNLVSFWIFGICNNFAYVVMLSAAQDILNKDDVGSDVEGLLKSMQHQNGTGQVTDTDHCIEDPTYRHCQEETVGLVLLANIIPMLIVKSVMPIFIHRIPYSVRHILICLMTAVSLLTTAFATDKMTALIGVCFASFSCGLGEMSFLGLASYYQKEVIPFWSSGTGMSGVAGSIVYALLTDVNILHLSPTTAMLVMLIVPFLFFVTYFRLLLIPSSIRKAHFLRPSSWIDLARNRSGIRPESLKSSGDDIKSATGEAASTSSGDIIECRQISKTQLAKILLKYMIPLFVVYVAQYYINQGVIELNIYDCKHSFRMGPASQYMWYQVLYQIGVFIAASTISAAQLSLIGIYLLPAIQTSLAMLFTVNSIYTFIPYFWLAALIVFCEGLVGGSTYGNVFSHIHRNVDPSIREFVLTTVSMADAVGILAAAIAAFPLHNRICQMPARRLFT